MATAIPNSSSARTRRTRAASRFARVGCAGLTVCLPCLHAFALDPAKAVTQYVSRAWRTEDGLPQVSVLAIVQTRDGYLWFGTQEGLVRFDGVRFRVFDRTNTPALRHNYVAALYEDSQGTLWIGTYGGGLTRLKDGHFTSYMAEHGLGSNVVWSMTGGPDGSLWLATGGGLVHLTHDRFEHYTTRDGLPANTVLALGPGPEGSLWIGTTAGLSRFKEGRFTNYSARQGLPHDVVTSLHDDGQGRLWVGTRGGGLARLEDGRWSSYTTRDGLTNDFVTALRADRDGNLWVGTDGGLDRLAEGRLSRYGTAEGLSGNGVRSLYEDLEGNLWVGTFGGGLNRLSDGPFTTYATSEGLSWDSTTAVYEDRQGSLWVGTARGGLNRFERERFSAFTTRDGLPSDSVTSLFEDREGTLWIGTRAGLSLRAGGRIRRLSSVPGLDRRMVRALFQDRAGALWIGTDDAGLIRLEGTSVSVHDTGTGLTGNTVFAILEDRHGSLWVGTDAGLNRFKEGALTTYTTKQGLASDIVLSLHEDDDGLWIGTGGGGLSRFEGGAFATYDTTDGLYDDTVFSVLEDRAGFLWMSCNKGVFRVRKSDLQDHAAGRVPRLTSISYGRADGMKSSECNGRVQPAAWRTHDGRLWFSTTKGLVTVNPAALRPHTIPPPVVIEELIVDRQPMSDESASLPPGSAHFEFHYTALNFMAPEKVIFKYKLDGVDDDWVEAGHRRVAYYTRIPPGSRRFTVVASNSDGVWSETGAVLPFTIRPYFHQTVWFYAATTLAVLLALGTAHRFRMSLLEARAAVLEERNRIAQEIHDSLAQGLAGIILQLEALKRETRRQSAVPDAYLERASDLARHSLEEARRSVWALRPALLDKADLPQALGMLVEQCAAEASARIELDVRGAPRPLSEQIEVNLFRIAQAAVTNALKHAAPQRVIVELGYDGPRVALRVTDDGRGFDGGPAGLPAALGFGIPNMIRRAKLLGARLAVRSAPGQGTEVSVVVRKARSWRRLLARRLRS